MTLARRTCLHRMVICAAAALSCGGSRTSLPVPAQAAAPAPASSTLADPIGPRPQPPASSPFLPPAPAVFTTANGITVWLLERHAVPLVACNMAVPFGASSDPKGKAGLAHVTANMLDEGAGRRGAIDLARELDDLGARLQTEANADSSFVSIAILKRNLDRAFTLFGDVIARPRLDPLELKRVRDLWHNALLQREKDPDATARVVFRVALFGADHPYGHPWDGTPASAKAIGIDEVRAFYAAHWRPDVAKLVCAGDVTREELTALLTAALGTWKAPATAAPAPVVPAVPKGPWPKWVLVDRADAPQAVIAVVKPGIEASNADLPALWLVNDAIGGSFTSRLNQDLREEHGYTYGARSRFSVSRGPGQVVVWANVATDKTGDALSAMLADLRKFAAEGMTDDEIDRARAQAREELVGVYESVDGIAGHLAADAALGLEPDYEAKAALVRQQAQRPQLDLLASRFYAPDPSLVVVVGPRSRIEAMVDKFGWPAPEIRDAVGAVVRGRP